jgi:hypothetical protein
MNGLLKSQVKYDKVYLLNDGPLNFLFITNYNSVHVREFSATL